MTPGARIAAAIEILDTWLGGMAAEQALTRWARANRYAGSGDRAAIRDHVYDAVRCRRSFAALGGGETGRGLMIGSLRAGGQDPALLFTGEGYAPPALSEAEGTEPQPLSDAPKALQLDVPDWLLPHFDASLGEDVDAVLRAMRTRAPVFLRANASRATREEARAALRAEGVEAVPHPLAETALEVVSGARKIRNTQAFANGLVELQDASSQTVVEALLPIPDGARVLDYCAGGGGKALAIAARTRATVHAHDVDPGRMSDIPGRAARAGASILCHDPGTLDRLEPFDLVFVDAPCSGSGAWRRQPEAKWRLTPERLHDLQALQSEVLQGAAALVSPGGTLAYATCSMLREENDDVVERFLSERADWKVDGRVVLTPLGGGDGFFLVKLRPPA